jgi:hypothetical protein
LWLQWQFIKDVKKGQGEIDVSQFFVVGCVALSRGYCKSVLYLRGRTKKTPIGMACGMDSFHHCLFAYKQQWQEIFFLTGDLYQYPVVKESAVLMGWRLIG